MSKTKSQIISEWIINLKYENIPKKMIDLAKQQLLGMLGACYAGSTTVGGKILKKSILARDHSEEATIFPTGEKVSAMNAFYTNSAFAMALDYDDYLGTVHTGTSSYAIGLAFGEKHDISGKEYLVNLVIGNEIGGRVGLSIYPPGEGQMQSFIHICQAVANLGRIEGLTSDQMANAFGIAMYQVPLPIPRGFFGPHSKLLTSSIPGKLGLEAVLLAKYGFTGALDIFENPQGFCKYNSEADYVKVIDNDLGAAWLTETLSFKIYPGCAYVDAIGDAVLDVLAKVLKKTGKKLNYKDIDTILIQNSLLSSMMDDMSRPFNTIDEIKRTKSAVATNFYQPLNVALILINEKFTKENLDIDKITDPEVHELAKKVTVKTDLGMSAKSAQIVPFKDLERKDFKLSNWNLSDWKMYCGCKLKITMKDGKKWTSKVNIPIGAAGGQKYPMEKKFEQEAVSIGMKKSQIDEVIKIINNLEDYNVRDLTRLLST
ncbi:MAG: MmgE/PrpD family protein [Candidatus Helarchaeota archaeon]